MFLILRKITTAEGSECIPQCLHDKYPEDNIIKDLLVQDSVIYIYSSTINSLDLPVLETAYTYDRGSVFSRDNSIESCSLKHTIFDDFRVGSIIHVDASESGDDDLKDLLNTNERNHGDNQIVMSWESESNLVWIRDCDFAINAEYIELVKR